MDRSKRIERRLRIASFLFITAAIFLLFGSMVIASQNFYDMVSNKAFMSQPQATLAPTMMAVVMSERLVSRCMVMAVMFMLLGVLFLNYLLLAKIQSLEENI